MSLRLGAGLAVVLAVLYQAIRSKHNKKLPPGPKPHWALGNLADIPTIDRWETYAGWKQKYGDVIYLNALGTSMVILNSQQACVDLLDKRSAIYSTRARLVMGRELMGWDYSFSSMEYSPRWRTYRRLFRQFFNEATVKSYLPVQEQNIHAFLRQTLRDPDNFLRNVRLSLTEIILGVTYGLKGNTEVVHLLEDGMKSLNWASIPGRYLVDMIPILKYVPSWLPGAGFKRQAAEWKILADNVRKRPAQLVKDGMKNGTADPSVFASMLTSCEDGTLDVGGFTEESPEEIAKNVMAQTYFAASDTTLISISTFFMALANHPEIQREAQAEIDSVTGSARLPTTNDLKDMPYTHAIVKEVLRLHSPVPLCLPHVSTEDDEYRGYFIPKGSIVFPNSWAILHDPEVYPDPYTFSPSRWLIQTEKGTVLNPDIPDPNATFGFGRRVCPGQFFAQNILFDLISNVLACFKLSPLDEDGRPVEQIEPRVDTTGFISFIDPFKLSIVPRSDRAAQLIAATE